ncbi:unnamed protein product, partial [Mycena citricolor]
TPAAHTPLYLLRSRLRPFYVSQSTYTQDGERLRRPSHPRCHPLPSRGRCFHHRLQLRPPYQHPPHDLRIHSWTHSCLLAHLQEDEGRGTLRTWWLPLRRERYLRAHQRWRSAAAVLWRNFQLKSRFLRS